MVPRGRSFCLPDGNGGDDTPQFAASEESSSRHQQPAIDFFLADERERRPPLPPDHRDLLVTTELETNLTLNVTPDPSAKNILHERYEEQLAIAKAELLRASEENRRLNYVLDHYQRQLQNCPSISNSNPHDGRIVPRPLLLHHRPSSSDGVSESSNSLAMGGRCQAVLVNHVGPPEVIRGKSQVMDVDEASDVCSEETVQDSEQLHGQNPSKKQRISPPPPAEKDKAAGMRKPRVTVRFRSETDDMNAIVKMDGCQWRKYGQKIPTSSPKTPRSYYKCSMTDKCPMRKHLQKYCDGDKPIVHATYEGTHNHQLNLAALTMKQAIESALKMVMNADSMTSGVTLMNTSDLAQAMSSSVALVPVVANVSISTPYPSALLDLSNNPDPALLQQQLPAAQLAVAVPGGAVPGEWQSQPQQLVFREQLAAPAEVPGYPALAGRSPPQASLWAAATSPSATLPGLRILPEALRAPGLRILPEALRVPGLRILPEALPAALPAALAAFHPAVAARLPPEKEASTEKKK